VQRAYCIKIKIIFVFNCSKLIIFDWFYGSSVLSYLNETWFDYNNFQWKCKHLTYSRSLISYYSTGFDHYSKLIWFTESWKYFLNSNLKNPLINNGFIISASWRNRNPGTVQCLHVNNIYFVIELFVFDFVLFSSCPHRQVVYVEFVWLTQAYFWAIHILADTFHFGPSSLLIVIRQQIYYVQYM